jgi:alanine racemase
MHRLGLEDGEITAQLKRLESNNHSNIGLMSHLGDAESVDSAMTQAQLVRWCAAVDKRSLPTSLLNSAAILHGYDTKSDWVRPGIMLYGAADLPTEHEDRLLPVMHFRSAVMALRWINESEVVGYGGRWQASKPTRVATVPVGYADGYPRTARNGTPVLIDGVECPLIGRVSMDMITVDVTALASVVK